MQIMRHSRDNGFTMTELLIVVGIVAVLAALAVPSFQGAIDKYRLKSAADTLRGDLQYARTQSITNNQYVSVNFNEGTPWCYGMIASSAPSPTCDCTTANSCSLKQVSSTDYPGNLTLAISGVAAVPTFEPVRGVVTPAGDVILQSALGKQAEVTLSLLGKVGVCTPSASTGTAGYRPC